MKILGAGGSLPMTVVTNDDLARFLDTNDEWIRTRTGIQSRRVLSDETLLSLGAEAGRRALEDAGIPPEEIDFLICSTVMGDTTTPSLACLLAGELRLRCAGVDLNAACAGFVYALDVADAYIKAGKARRILIVGAEANSRLCDWSERRTCVLFGDGAGAVVVGEGTGYLAARLTTQTNLGVLSAWPEPGNSPWAQARQHPYAPLQMSGQDVYKFAVSASVRDLRAVCEDAGIEPDAVDLFVLHQANLRIIDAVRQRLGQPESKFPANIQRTGNTSSASIPLLLDELKRGGLLWPGMTLALSAFGAGLITGACVLRW